MWQKMFEKEIAELKELGIQHTVVKCGTFYTIQQVVQLYKLLKEAKEKYIPCCTKCGMPWDGEHCDHE